MRILRLDLIAYGPFTRVTLDLSAGDHGLHLIHGPNEAGKSSALRAITDVLYGIGERTSDDFLHPYNRLRLGATLRRKDGTELQFVRRKARVGAIRKANDTDILDSTELDGFLAGVDAALFRTLFAINHATLVKGGREIVAGQGDLGRVLFAASSGIASVRGVLEALRTDAEVLFKPQGRNQRINQALTELYTAQENIKRLQLSSDEWLRHEKALEQGQQEKKRIEDEIRQRGIESNRLTRMQNAHPLIARHQQLLTELKEYDGVVQLAEDFSEVRRQAVTALDLAEGESSQASDIIAKLQERLTGLDVSEPFLNQGTVVERLFEQIGSYRKSQNDRQKLVARRQQLEHEARVILRELNRPSELDQAEQLRLPVDQIVTIQNLGNENQGLIANCENAQDSIETLQRRLEGWRRQLSELPPSPNTSTLAAAIRFALQAGGLEQRLTDDKVAYKHGREEAGVRLSQLPYWSGTLEQLERLAVPPPETVDRFESRFSACSHQSESLDGRIGEVHSAEQELEADIRQLELEEHVPSEEELRQARSRRQAGWQMVRRAWQARCDETDGSAGFIAEFPPTQDLATAYEQSVENSDAIADRLRREADRVARMAALLAQRDGFQKQLGQLREQRDEVIASLAQTQQDWQDLLQPMGLPSVNPVELRAWLRPQGELVRQAADIRAAQGQIGLLEESLATCKDRLAAALKLLNEPPLPPGATLIMLLEASQMVVDRYSDAERRREQLQKEIAAREQELEAIQSRAVRAQEKYSRWQENWASAVVPLGLGSTASPAAANARLGKISELFQKIQDAHDFQSRISGIDRDAEQFAADVQAVVERIAPELASVSPERAVEEMFARLGRVRKVAQERESVVSRRVEETEKQRGADQKIREAQTQLRVLCEEAGCTSVNELPERERRSVSRAGLERSLRECNEQLLGLSAGPSLAAFLADAEQVDRYTLTASLHKLQQETQQLQESLSQVDQQIGSERNELAKMDGSAMAAEAAERVENVLAQLQADIPQFAALRLAEVVLQRAIERHRDKNQGPVLNRASEIFAQLTDGSFESLRIDYNEHGEPVLVGVRPGGQAAIGVEGMSDGSCDQLYLALRLASLESWLGQHEPMPFIVDDILLNFDDVRAVAALRALGELCRRTQVIFFTHHQHLVDLAEANLDRTILCKHILPGRQPM